MGKQIAILVVSILFSMNAVGQKGNSWINKYYTVSGNWSVEKESGKSYLVLHSDFKTSKGPDLKLFLTKKDATSLSKKDAVQKHGLLLGNLKSIKGEQHYLISAHITLSDYKSIVVHCEKYTKIWGASPL